MTAAGTAKRVRTAVVLDHPAQQFAAGLRLLAADSSVDLHVYYGSAAASVHDSGFGREISWDADLLGGYRSAAPPGGSPAGCLRWLTRSLRRDRPDVIICYGWASRVARAAIGYSALSRTPLLMYGDTTWQHSSRGRRSRLRSAAIRAVLRLCAGAVDTGTFNREFYIQHGMDPARIWPGVCPADTGAFAAAARPPAGAAAAPGLPLRIGFAGKLIPRKGADVLLRAAALLPAEPAWSLTVIGDGPLLGGLRDLAGQLGIGSRVSFCGFANTSAMPGLLAACDVVAVPSRLDMRALVTIEAMAAGAVVVVSDATAVWGPGDLIAHGRTGLVHATGDAADLARQLGRLLADRQLLARLRRSGLATVTDYGPAAFAATMAAAARGVTSGAGRIPRRPG